MIRLREGIFLHPSGSLLRFCRLFRSDLAHAQPPESKKIRAKLLFFWIPAAYSAAVLLLAFIAWWRNRLRGKTTGTF